MKKKNGFITSCWSEATRLHLPEQGSGGQVASFEKFEILSSRFRSGLQNDNDNTPKIDKGIRSPVFFHQKLKKLD